MSHRLCCNESSLMIIAKKIHNESYYVVFGSANTTVAFPTNKSSSLCPKLRLGSFSLVHLGIIASYRTARRIFSTFHQMVVWASSKTAWRLHDSWRVEVESPRFSCWVIDLEQTKVTVNFVSHLTVREKETSTAEQSNLHQNQTSQSCVDGRTLFVWYSPIVSLAAVHD